MVARGQELVCWSMGLLDDVPPRFDAKNLGKGYRSPHDRQTEEEKLSELNNLGRGEVTEDYSDSPHADRV